MLRGPLPIACPVRLLQGMRDAAVPWQTAVTLADRLTGDDVVVELIKDGDHRLSRNVDLARLAAAIGELAR
jgi:alpha-beta hydrolase superfamily lysophospholipase